jgi:large subunit ribosomal protein L25
MKALKLSGSLRENVGKKDAKKLRKEGNVPCVLYGGEKQIHFSMPEKDFKSLVFTPHSYLLEITIDGQEYTAILQDIQFHPVSDNILHADFLKTFEDKPITIAIPVQFTGVSKGVLKGGKLIRKFRKLKVQALPKDLPDEIVVDITNLGINQSVKVAGLTRPNLTFLDPPTAVVVIVKTARGAVDEEEESGDDEGAEGDAPTEEQKAE